MDVLGQGIATEPLLSRERFHDALMYDPIEKTGYVPQCQEVVDFHNSPARIRIVSAPARTSKSYTAFAEIAWWMMPRRPLLPSLHWVIGPTYRTNKEFDYLWEAFVVRREQWRFEGKELKIERARNNPAAGELEFVLDWGRNERGQTCRAVVQGLSSTHEKSLQGEEVTTATLSEAAEHPKQILTKYLSTRAWKILMPTTPKPKAEWIRELIEAGEKDGSLGIASWTFPPHANPKYNHKRLAEEGRKAALRSPTGRAEDDPYFAEQFLGRWVYYTGRVLPFAERHLLPAPPRGWEGWKHAISVDYGYEDPTSVGFWGISPHGILVRLSELYGKHWTTETVVEKTLARCEEIQFSPSYCTGDPSRPEVSRIFHEAGLPIFAMDKNAQRDRAAGHRRLVDLLTEGPLPGKPGLFVVQGDGIPWGCPQTIREWRHLRYREGFKNEYGTTSIEGDDHAFDDARAFVMTRPTPKPPEEARDWLMELRQRMRRPTAMAGFGRA